MAIRQDKTGQLRQNHMTATTIFGASSHGELRDTSKHCGHRYRHLQDTTKSAPPRMGRN